MAAPATVTATSVRADTLTSGASVIIRDGFGRLRLAQVFRVEEMRNGGVMVWCSQGFRMQVPADQPFVSIT
jgi:hypothetical protein